jgi:hypothetical protein
MFTPFSNAILAQHRTIFIPCSFLEGIKRLMENDQFILFAGALLKLSVS